MCCLCFFFSSRRRHTRFDCDWSSDVCSSDLLLLWKLERMGPEVLEKLQILNVQRMIFRDRKSTRLNSSHSQISYAVFCLKKKKPLTASTLTQAQSPGGIQKSHAHVQVNEEVQ